MLVDRERIAGIWPEVSALVTSADRRGPCGCDSGGIMLDCIEGIRQLWIVRDGSQTREIRGCAVVTLHGESRGRMICEWTLAAGISARDWMGFSVVIEDWARRLGCTAMRSFSRKGMRRAYLTTYASTGEILEKVL